MVVEMKIVVDRFEFTDKSSIGTLTCGDWHCYTLEDGSTASYYELPEGATELQDLISYRNMNGQLAEIFRACYRYGLVDHSSMLRDAKKIKFYAEAEIDRIEKYVIKAADG